MGQPEVFAVTPEVWCVRRRSYLTCSYVMKTSEGIVLIDAGMDSEGADVEFALARAFGARASDVRAILLTHWHNDHAAGARAIQERSAARVYARLRPFGFLLIVLLLLVIPWFFPGLGVVQRFVLPPVLWAQDKYLDLATFVAGG